MICHFAELFAAEGCACREQAVLWAVIHNNSQGSAHGRAELLGLLCLMGTHSQGRHSQG